MERLAELGKDDSGTITIEADAVLAADTELLEIVCAERSRQLPGRVSGRRSAPWCSHFLIAG
jgi:hypothetical protein